MKALFYLMAVLTPLAGGALAAAFLCSKRASDKSYAEFINREWRL